MNTLWTKLKLILTLRCDQASLLVSDSFDRKLAIHERIALRGHWIACRTCPLFRRQLEFVRRALQQSAQVSDRDPCSVKEADYQLSAKAKQRIVEAVRQSSEA